MALSSPDTENICCVLTLEHTELKTLKSLKLDGLWRESGSILMFRFCFYASVPDKT